MNDNQSSQVLSIFSETHCKNCQAGFMRTTSEGKTYLMCLIDREPVLRNLTTCNKYKEAVA